MEEIIEKIFKGEFVLMDKDYKLSIDGNMFIIKGNDALKNMFMRDDLRIDKYKVLVLGGKYFTVNEHCSTDSLIIYDKDIIPKEFEPIRIIMGFNKKNKLVSEKMYKFKDENLIMHGDLDDCFVSRIELNVVDYMKKDIYGFMFNDMFCDFDIPGRISRFLSWFFRLSIYPVYIILVDKDGREVLYIKKLDKIIDNRILLSRSMKDVALFNEDAFQHFLTLNNEDEYIFKLYEVFLSIPDNLKANLKIVALAACVDNLGRKIIKNKLVYLSRSKNNNRKGPSFNDCIRAIITYSDKNIEDTAIGSDILIDEVVKARNAIVHGDGSKYNKYKDILRKGVLWSAYDIKNIEEKLTLEGIIWIAMKKMIWHQ